MTQQSPAAALYDLAVIGGGVNGCGIARDASGRGAKVLLLERGDLAQGTSSASTKLIHGGLRYLEHREFGLVREALAELPEARELQDATLPATRPPSPEDLALARAARQARGGAVCGVAYPVLHVNF